MSIAQTQLTGPIYMPNGVAPTEGQVFFELSSWDKQEGEALFVSGPYSAPIDENGQFSVDLFTTTEGDNQVVYRMSVHYLDENQEKKKEYIGYFALAGEGPFSIHDLTIESELIPSTFDVLAEIQAYKTAIEGYYESFENLNTYTDQINNNTSSIETLTNSQVAGVIAYETKAIMDADLSYDENTIAYVREDSTDTNNGIYRKVGAASTGSWTFVTELPESVFNALDVDIKKIPINRHDEALRTPGGWLTANSGNRVTLQNDGTYSSTQATWSVDWDFPIDGGKVYTVDWLDLSGVTMTVEEVTTAGTIINTDTITEEGGRRQHSATADALADIIRVRLAGPSSGTNFEPPAFAFGVPASAPTDPDYLSLMMDAVTAIDGASLAGGISSTNATSGAINSTSGQTIDVATGTNFTADYALSAAPQSDFVVLLEIGTTFTPRACTITPLLIGGGTGDALDVMAKRWGADNTRFIMTAPSEVGGVTVIGLRLTAYTLSGGGPNIGTAGAATFTLTPFASASVPSIREVPTVLQTAIDVEGLATDAKITTATTALTADVDAISDYPYLGRLDRRFADLMDAAQFVSAAGDDLNAGTARAASVETLTQAMSNGTAGDIIALKAGETHSITDGTDRANIADFSLIAFDDGTSAPVLDRCNDVPTWTLVSGSTLRWEAVVTLDEAATPAASVTSSNTFLPKVYADDVLLTPVWGGADIAANETTVESTAGSMTMHQDGSTAQDPRTDTSGTKLDYRVVVHLPDGSDPNSADMRVSGANSIALLGDGQTYRNLTMRGANGKDNISTETYSGALCTAEDTTILDIGEHGGVGPTHIKGKLIGNGYPTPGRAGYDLGRGTANAWNLFTNVDRTDVDVVIDHIEMHNGDKILYGHGSGNLGYKSVTIGKLVGRNVSTGISFDDINVSTEFITDGVTVSEVDLDDIDNAFSVGGNLTISSGRIIFGTEVATGNGQVLTSLTGAAPVHRFTDVVFKANLTYVAFSKTYTLCRRDNLITDTMPVVYFDGCTDLNQPDVRLDVALRSDDADPRKVMRLARGGILSQLFLHLDGETLLGDVMDQASGTNYPSGLYVGEGCVFGMGDRTRAAIRTALSGAGQTEDETDANNAVEDTFFIHDETWIVNRDGALIDVPVSLGGSS